MSVFEYNLEPNLSTEEFIDILQRSTLAERRPVSEKEIIFKMLKNASIIVTCRNQQNKIIGVARAITDYSFCTYLSDLAVDEEYQRQGIGKKLIEHTHKYAGLETTLILLAAPKAQTYYEHIGMEPHNSCWLQKKK